MKGQNDGIENEKQIVSALDEKQVKRLTEYTKKLVLEMYSGVDENAVVHARKIGGQGYKPDVEIEINNERRSVSVKKGGGNSVHQEKTDYFLHYCMTRLGMTEEERESLLMFLYGDGTLDGDSLPEDRLKDQALVKVYQKQIEIVQKFLDRNKRSLIERFLIYGRLGVENNIRADYLYHGDATEGVWCPLDYDTVDFLASVPNVSDSPLSIGPLTLQVWNRNLDGKPEFENRRHSIQVKWASCKAYVEKINELHLKKMLELKNNGVTDYVITNSHVKGNNQQGFENQENLINIMNENRLIDLPSVVKNIVQKMFPNAAQSEIVRAAKVTGNDVKPRMSVMVNGEKKNLTVFMGSGNSVHQEKFDNFLEYCRAELGIKKDEEEAFLRIMYGDGTLDGDSRVTERLKNTEDVKSKYGYYVEIAQKFFNRNKKALIERFLIYGKGGKAKNIKADFIYYGTDTTGRLLPYPDVIEFLINKEGSESALLSLGSLTTQPWNRNPEGKPNLEDRRHSLQIKWGGMKQDLAELYNELNDGNKGTIEGDWEEYELVSKLNRDKRLSNKLWETLSYKHEFSSLDNVYAVRVSNMVYSKLSERMVLPKADVYLVRGKIDHQVLLDNNYWLDEDVIENLDCQPIKYSGISCKRPNSSSFTYAKFTIKSFIALFKEPVLGAGISLFVNEKDCSLNNEVLKSWNVTQDDIRKYFKAELGDIIGNIADINVAKIVKSASIRKTSELIKKNREYGDAIFYGKGLFDEPYTASYIYRNGNLSETYVPDFSITTGSGRHKGTYTIVIKP